ncbi:MAG: hypothetical protein ACRYF3_12875, partial [Janthinobacterium lividum]
SPDPWVAEEEHEGFWAQGLHAVDHFVEDHAAGLKKVSGGLKVVSAAAGVLSLVPVLAPITAPIAVATGAAAVGIDASVKLVTGEGSWTQIGVDAALMALPGVGKVVGKSLEGTALAATAGRVVNAAVNATRVGAAGLRGAAQGLVNAPRTTIALAPAFSHGAPGGDGLSIVAMTDAGRAARDGWKAGASKVRADLAEAPVGVDASPGGRQGAAPSKEESHETHSFEAARNKALELMGKLDESTRKPYISTLERSDFFGQVVGFETRVDGTLKRLRIDWDPDKGPHFNVTIGRGRTGEKHAVTWPGTRDETRSIHGGNFDDLS